MAKLLIAITTCHARRHQADAQRASWVQDVNPAMADVRFFLGGFPHVEESGDTVLLPVDDSYEGLPAKVKATMEWARARDYWSVLKLDDDVYLVPERLKLIPAGEYIGNFRMHTGKYPADYASGFAYWLGARATAAVAEAPLTDDPNEDRWVGNVMDVLRPRPQAVDEKRFCTPYPTGVEEPAKLWGSNLGRTGIAFAQYPAERFAELHKWYKRVFDEGVTGRPS